MASERQYPRETYNADATVFAGGSDHYMKFAPTPRNLDQISTKSNGRCDHSAQPCLCPASGTGYRDQHETHLKAKGWKREVESIPH